MKDKNERYCLFDCLPCGYCIELKEPGDKKVAYCSTCELGCFLEDKTCCAPLIIPTVCCWCRTSETCVHFDDDVKIKTNFSMCEITCNFIAVGLNCCYNSIYIILKICNCNNCVNKNNSSNNKKILSAPLENTQTPQLIGIPQSTQPTQT